MEHLTVMIDQAADALIAAGLCSGRVVGMRNDPVQADELPVARVFVSADQAEPDGDARTTVGFVHVTELVVEVVDHANAGNELQAKLARHAETIMRTLVASRRWALGVDQEPWLEGIGGATQTYIGPPEGDRVGGAVQVQLQILWRSVWVETLPANAPALGTVSAGAPGGVGADVTVPAAA
jgi:hypothetical protein